MILRTLRTDTEEAAAGTADEKANFTLGACSGLSVCPA